MLNFMLQIPASVQIVGDNTNWLIFWSNYLGAIISTLTTLFVLYRTLQQNQEENKNNRTANEQANEKNRQLQINVLKYQQQMQWLNSFRETSAQYIQIYNANDLIAIANILIINPQEAHDMLKSLFDRAIIYDTQFAYLCKDDNNTKELLKKISPKFDQYNDVLQDIQQIITFRRNHPTQKFGSLVSQIHTINMSQNMKKIITENYYSQHFHSLHPFIEVILARINDLQDDMTYIQDLLHDYIHAEQARINKSLEE